MAILVLGLVIFLGLHSTRIVSESADLLYHLLVLWADAGVPPADIWTELARREGTSGHKRHDGDK